MSDFIASNGMTVSPHTNPAIPLIIKNGNEIFSLSRLEAEAAREYFQHERDQEVDRWRWPGDHDIVVYPERKGSVFCFDEATGEGAFGKRGSFDEGNYWDHVARDYFDAHPEKQPWHDAQEEEVWLLSSEGEGTHLDGSKGRTRLFGVLPVPTPHQDRIYTANRRLQYHRRSPHMARRRRQMSTQKTWRQG